MTDRADQASDEIKKWYYDCESKSDFSACSIAAIIRRHFADSEARAEHLERTLAEVRALCESTAPWHSIRDAVLAILNRPEQPQ